VSPRQRGNAGSAAALKKNGQKLPARSRHLEPSPERPRDSSDGSAIDVVPLCDEQGYDELIAFLVEEAVRAWKAENS